LIDLQARPGREESPGWKLADDPSPQVQASKELHQRQTMSICIVSYFETLNNDGFTLHQAK
jgi:hypothetical protein